MPSFVQNKLPLHVQKNYVNTLTMCQVLSKTIFPCIPTSNFPCERTKKLRPPGGRGALGLSNYSPVNSLFVKCTIWSTQYKSSQIFWPPAMITNSHLLYCTEKIYIWTMAALQMFFPLKSQMLVSGHNPKTNTYYFYPYFFMID